MSALFGVAAFDGRPIDSTVLDPLRRAHAGWPCDRDASRAHASAAMGVRLLLSTDEAAGDRMPVLDAARGTLMTAIARLDNRDELAEVLDVPPSARPSIADSTLVALAVARWDAAAAEQLFGDWSFALWHAADRRLVLARDQMGSTGLFYARLRGAIAFASNPEAVAGRTEAGPAIDELFLARYLAIQPGDPERTFWRDVQAVPSGHLLVADPAGVTTRRYWNPDRAPGVRLRSTEEYVDGFLHHYRRAVHVRLRGSRPAAATLSAGLDSSSVTALAAEALRSRGRRLTAFTAAPMAAGAAPGATSIGDESALAAEVANTCGNVDHVVLRAPDASPTAALRRSFEGYPGLVHAAGNLHWLLQTCEEARRLGCGALLVGQLGNLGVSWEGRTAPAGTVRGVAAWRARRGVSWTTTIRSQVLGPLLRSLARRMRRRASASDWRANAMLNPAFAARLRLDEVFAAAPEGSTLSTRELRGAGLFLNAYVAGPTQHGMGAAHGLELRDPTGDVRLVEFCLGVPEEQHVDASGTRLLMRRSMEGLLPPSVQWNYRRGQQSSDIVERLRRHRRDVDDVLGAFERDRAVPQYLDLARLREIWDRVRRQPVTPRLTGEASGMLLRGIMAGLFVQRNTTKAE